MVRLLQAGQLQEAGAYMDLRGSDQQAQRWVLGNWSKKTPIRTVVREPVYYKVDVSGDSAMPAISESKRVTDFCIVKVLRVWPRGLARIKTMGYLRGSPYTEQRFVLDRTSGRWVVTRLLILRGGR